jgi:hypothetical protein
LVDSLDLLAAVFVFFGWAFGLEGVNHRFVVEVLVELEGVGICGNLT